MHKNVFARLAANKAVALGVIEPLYCSCFHIVCTCCSFCVVTLERVGRKTCAGDLLLRRRAAHDRFGLTHTWILRSSPVISNMRRRHRVTPLFTPAQNAVRAEIRAFCAFRSSMNSAGTEYLCGGTAENNTAMYVPPRMKNATLLRSST